MWRHVNQCPARVLAGIPWWEVEMNGCLWESDHAQHLGPISTRWRVALVLLSLWKPGCVWRGLHPEIRTRPSVSQGKGARLQSFERLSLKFVYHQSASHCLRCQRPPSKICGISLVRLHQRLQGGKKTTLFFFLFYGIMNNYDNDWWPGFLYGGYDLFFTELMPLKWGFGQCFVTLINGLGEHINFEIKLRLFTLACENLRFSERYNHRHRSLFISFCCHTSCCLSFIHLNSVWTGDWTNISILQYTFNRINEKF